MSNYTEQHDKIAVHLQELYKKHRSLDEEIKMFIINLKANKYLTVWKHKNFGSKTKYIG